MCEWWVENTTTAQLLYMYQC